MFPVVLVAYLLAVAAGGAPPSRPAVPKQFRSRFDQLEVEDGKTYNWTTGYLPGAVTTLHYDRTGERMLIAREGKFSLAPEEMVGTPYEYFNSSQLTLAHTGVHDANGVCHVTGPKFSPLFDWVGSAVYSGKGKVQGVEADFWELRSPTGPNLTLAAKGNLPVMLVANLSASSSSVSYFSDIQPLDPSAFSTINVSRCEHPAPCERRPPANLTAYIYHPAHNFNISDQDVADLNGEVSFICMDIMMQRPPAIDHNYSWITEWVIEVDGTWGQYQPCNGYGVPVCEGANDFLVGKEGSMTFGKGGGQCTDTSSYGAWYSLPSKGECPHGEQPGDGSCTWRKVHRVKTIEGDCLLRTLPFAQHCSNARIPFPDAVQVFREAFSGACPEIVP